MTWIESISVSPKIQKAEVSKAEEERLSGGAIARISSLEDEAMQEKVYKKAPAERMETTETSKLVKVTQGLEKGAREVMLRPESGITPKVGEKALELPKEEQEKVLKQIDSLRLTEEEEAIEHIEGMKVEITPPSEEEWEEIRAKYEEIVEETKQRMETPEAEKRGRLFKNWLGHTTIAGATDSVFCPICGSEAKNLAWRVKNIALSALRKLWKKPRKNTKKIDMR